MKNITLLFCLFLSTWGFSQLSLPIDFESSTITYTFTDFDGGQMTVEDNPQQTGINTSTKVAKMVKNAGQPWGGSFMELEAPIDFSTNRIFKMKVFAPAAGTRVLLKVENISNSGIFFEKEDTTTVGNEWEELTFDYSSVSTSASYQKIIIIFELGVAGDGSANFTYLLDDIQLEEGEGNPLAQIDLPVTFEDGETVDYSLVDFGGNSSSIVVDPTDAGNMVAQSTKTGTAETWGGTTMGANGFANPVSFTATNTKVTVRVWSPDAGTPVLLKVEDATNPNISVETLANTTMAMAWETLEFDFNNPAPETGALNLANTYNKMSIFFNFGTDGATAGEKTYYWDDVQFLGSTLAQIDLPVTFEDGNVAYSLADFGGNSSSIVVDPTDAGNMVAQSIKSETAEVWGGTTMGANGFASPIPFSATDTKMTVKVWSPDAGTPILLKAEDATNPNISVETLVNTTQAMAWETLEFDFSNPAPETPALDLANTYSKLSIFFNFGTDGATAGEKTYYWDEVRFGLLSKTVEVLNAADHGIKIAPNPANNYFNIEFPEVLPEGVMLSLFDVSGKLLKQEKTRDQLSRMETFDIVAGTYFLRIDTAKASYYQKVMISK